MATGNPTGCCGFEVPCCEGRDLPDTLTATVITSDCPCAGMLTVPLHWEDSRQTWRGTKAFGSCGRTIIIDVYCEVAAHFELNFEFDDDCQSPQNIQDATTGECGADDALYFEFDGGLEQTCCDGPWPPGIRFIVTE